MPLFSAPKGTHDILADQFYARQSTSRRILRVLEKYGFREVTTPAFEEIDVLKAKAGEQIIEQIYDFRDKGGRHLGLRSDITASIGRLVGPTINSLPKPVKISSYDRLWRYERPQAGRYREFFQINAEMFGANSPPSDAEIIACFCECYDSVGLFDYKIHIGHRRLLEAFIKTLGVPEEKLSSVIRAVDKAPKLSADELRAEVIRSGLDPASLPALDQFTALSGSLDGTLSKAMSLYGHAGLLRSSLDELRAIANALELYGVASKCILDLAIARGSDYYTGAIFECKYDTKLVGSIGGGGRYDNLIEVYGGPPTPAVGFSVGFERVMTLLNSLKLIDPKVLVPPTDVYIVIVDESCLEAGIKAAQSLRKSDWTVEVDLLHRKVKAQLSHASSLNARMSVIIGPDEIAANQITLRDMMSREEKLIDLDKLVNELSSALKALPQNY